MNPAWQAAAVHGIESDFSCKAEQPDLIFL